MDPTVAPPGGRPVVLVCGKRGAGKSTLIDALTADDDASPAPRYLEVDSGAALDTLEVLAQIDLVTTEMPDVPHHLVLVVGAPDRALDEERALVEALGRDGLRSSLTLVLNQVDALPPRAWDPAGFDPDALGSPKAANVAKWAGYVRDALDVGPERTFLTVAAPDAGPYGVPALRAALARRLADGTRVRVTPPRPREAPARDVPEPVAADRTLLWVAQAATGIASLLEGTATRAVAMLVVLAGMLAGVALAHRVRALDLRIPAGALAGAGLSYALLAFLAARGASPVLATVALEVVTLAAWWAYRYALLRGIAGPASRAMLRR